jgi:beta-galactosidase
MLVVLLRTVVLSLFCFGCAWAQAPVPAQEAGFTRSLNGAWSFKYVAGPEAGADEGFTDPRFDASGWRSIAVPSNWELQGFAEPRYADALEQGLGLYRRSFAVPEGWRGRRVFLRFEGVAFGYELWVNGKKAGSSSASAFNAHAFDVTDLVAVGADNLLALRVTTRPQGVEFDLNDDWSLAGIYRDVSLFSLPATHLREYATATEVHADGAARLAVSAGLAGTDGTVRAELSAPDGRRVAQALMRPDAQGRHGATLAVPRAALWSAETPVLYRLKLQVLAKGKVVQHIESRVGLRQVSIAKGVLLLNGRPIKLRGVNHHDLDPEGGRAIPEARLRSDLALMKKGTVNYVRTSHYPPTRRLLELCDELGFYVMDEVAIGHGEANLDKPDYRAGIMARVEATIARDRNHASVLIWSIGNENPITQAELDAARLAKLLDPTRPVTIPKVGSYFAANHERLPSFVDIHAPHYPVNATLAAYATKLDRPTILTEYAHALGLATDRIQDQWDILQAHPVFAGGSIWHFMDQAILRTSATPVDRSKPTQLVWLDAHRYLDTHGLDGADGLTYGERTPQTDFWQMRKVYAPVQFKPAELRLGQGRQRLAIELENRHDFRSLRGMRLHWALEQNGRKVGQGELPLHAAARARETVAVELTPPPVEQGDVLVLALRCVDEHGLQINERALRLRYDALQAAQPAAPAVTEMPELTETADEVRVRTTAWTLSLARRTGQLSVRDAAGQLLLAGIHPHTGRTLSMAEELSLPKRPLWRSVYLPLLAAPAIEATQSGDAIELGVAGRFHAEGKPQEALSGGYRLRIGADGTLDLRYDFTAAETAQLSEAGLSLVAPPALTEFRWIGQGPYAGYPGKHRLNEFGLHHLARADLRFQGNRRGTEFAMLTAGAGQGVAMALAPGDVAVERQGENTVISHNALIGGLGNKGTLPETMVTLQPGQRISGRLRLMLLAPAWPAQVARWFGAVPPTPLLAPFHHSYDQ